MASFSNYLQTTGHPIVLDGGLATELERRGHDISGSLWSARVLVDAPEAIEQLHYDYFLAGADCVISASYQASYEGFAAEGISADVTTRLLDRSVELAIAARERIERESRQSNARRRFVAASIGPYGATRHDGSEYHGNYDRSIDELIAFHAPRLAALASAGADILACETIPSLDEVRALTTVLANHPQTEAWMSLTSADGLNAAHGEPLVECARHLDRCVNVVAVGVNCVHPRVVDSAIESIRAGTDKPIVVYPNSGERWNAVARRWEGVPAGWTLAERAESWIDAGARMIGGCCRTGPSEIEALANAVRQQ